MKVKFALEELPVVKYNRYEFRNVLRDKFAQLLIKQLSYKIINKSDRNKKLTEIFENALESKLTTRELARIEPLANKFLFLEHDGSRAYDDIHNLCYRFMALCNKDKNTVIKSLPSWNVFDAQGNRLRYPLNYEYNKALCADIADLTKECIKEFLEELHTTKNIMTSKKLVEYNRELVLTTTTGEEEDNHSNDRFESEGDKDIKPSSGDNSSQDLNQRSISFQDSKEENDKSNKAETKVDDTNSLFDLALQKFLSWVNDLPEWLQKLILNSSAVRAVIESIEQEAKIYDKKVDLYIYAKDQIFSEEEYLSYIDNAIDQKVAISEVSKSELVDTSMILDGQYVSGLILPISGEQVINFNDLNFNDFAIF